MLPYSEFACTGGTARGRGCNFGQGINSAYPILAMSEANKPGARTASEAAAAADSEPSAVKYARIVKEAEAAISKAAKEESDSVETKLIALAQELKIEGLVEKFWFFPGAEDVYPKIYAEEERCRGLHLSVDLSPDVSVPLWVAVLSNDNVLIRCADRTTSASRHDVYIVFAPYDLGPETKMIGEFGEEVTVFAKATEEFLAARAGIQMPGGMNGYTAFVLPDRLRGEEREQVIQDTRKAVVEFYRHCPREALVSVKECLSMLTCKAGSSPEGWVTLVDVVRDFYACDSTPMVYKAVVVTTYKEDAEGTKESNRKAMDACNVLFPRPV